jgi:hypothetical protein
MDYTYFLNAKPSIKLFVNIGEEEGIINLCSSYGCYDKTSTIELKKRGNCKTDMSVLQEGTPIIILVQSMRGTHSQF